MSRRTLVRFEYQATYPKTNERMIEINVFCIAAIFVQSTISNFSTGTAVQLLRDLVNSSQPTKIHLQQFNYILLFWNILANLLNGNKGEHVYDHLFMRVLINISF